MNDSLMEDVLEANFLATLSYMQKGKIPSLNSLMVEFYVGFYDLIKSNLLKMVKYI